MGSNWLRGVGEMPGLSVWRIDGKSQEISVVPKGSYPSRKILTLQLHQAAQFADILLAFKAHLVCSDLMMLTFTWIPPLEEIALNIPIPSFCGLEKRFLLRFVLVLSCCAVIVWANRHLQQDFATKCVSELEFAVKSPCTLYRECQEHESTLFVSMFKFRGGVQYVEPLSLQKQKNLRNEEHPTKLYHLKGKRNVRVKQIDVDASLMNRGDVFVLDANDTIYQWNGHSCSRMEKAKALDLTVRLRDERMNRLNAKVILVDDGREPEEFWTAIGGKKPIKEAAEGGDDEEFEKSSVQALKLYRCWHDESKVLRHEQSNSANQPLHRSMLDSQFAYIVDAETELFIWSGRSASPKLRDETYALAQKLVREQGRPNWAPVVKVVEGVEPALFKSKFKGTFTEFIDNPEHLKGRLQKISKTAGTLRNEKVNVDALLHPEKYAIAREDDIFEKVIPGKSADDDSELKIWFVKDSKKHELPLEEYGFFYSHETYVVHFSIHLRSGGYKHVLYFWIGRKSAKDDQGTAALLASDMAAKLGRSATQVRVVQNKEPEHFLSHFEGYMVVRNGKREDWMQANKDSIKLYQLRGTNSIDTRAIQVKAVCASLNSNDAFLLDSPKAAFSWIGKGANEFERSLAQTVPKRVLVDPSQQPVYLNEGEESEVFWNALGGKTPYSDQPELAVGNVKARLFQVSDRTSVLKAIEVPNFAQDDLDETDVMILDAFTELFVWIGKGSTDREKQEGVKIAQEYIKLADDGRSPDCPIYVVQQGEEPPLFTVYFAGWSEEVSRSGDDLYARKLKTLSTCNFFSVANGNLSTALSAGTPTKPSTSAPAPATGTPDVVPKPAPTTTSSLAKQPIVDYDRLKVKPIPDGVDPQNKECHLSDAEFNEVFKMSREAWAAVPAWKKLRVKKEVQLF